jgi:iron(II)-dependent oxidoreductase
MQSTNNLKWMRAVAGPMGRAYGSVLMKFPQWLGGAFRSTCSTALTKSARSKSVISKNPQPDVADTGDSADTLADFVPPLRHNSGTTQSLVDEMLAQSRYALLLRPQLIGNLTVEQLALTRAALSDGMCVVPEGDVMLHHVAENCVSESEPSDHGGVPLRVDAYYLDRYPVTNSQFHYFVSKGGYEQMAIWDQEIWPAVLDFVDRTGHPGPRFWRNGCYLRGQDNYPVVGVSWYEASAYARWAGKRLATDAEWIKAGSWPVALAGHPLLQRRYPWGEAMDRGRANLWGSGSGKIVSVEEYPGGVSVGGVQQLIGNVWEWTTDPFALHETLTASGEKTSFKSLRGGAFDTYLDTQATCHFQSGDKAMARKHNIGFRTAISLCDLTHREVRDEPDLAEPIELSLAETHS